MYVSSHFIEYFLQIEEYSNHIFSFDETVLNCIIQIYQDQLISSRMVLLIPTPVCSHLATFFKTQGELLTTLSNNSISLILDDSSLL